MDSKDRVVRYYRSQVEPHVPDSWVDGEKIRRAYEINFRRHFFTYTPPRPLEEIIADIKQTEEELAQLRQEWQREWYR